MPGALAIPAGTIGGAGIGLGSAAKAAAKEITPNLDINIPGSGSGGEARSKGRQQERKRASRVKRGGFLGNILTSPLGVVDNAIRAGSSLLG